MIKLIKRLLRGKMANKGKRQQWEQYKQYRSEL